MRLRDQMQEASAADDYTPATDLVFSMLALTLLLLALFGTKTTINTSDMSGRINFLTAQGQSQDKSLEKLREDLVKKDKEIQRLIEKSLPSPETASSKNAEIAGLEDQLAKLREDLVKKDKEIKRLIEMTSPLSGLASAKDAKIADLEAETASKQARLDLKDAENADITHQLADARRRSVAEIRFAPFTQETFGPLRQLDGSASDAIIGQIKKNLKSKQGDIEKYDLNEVFIRIESALHTGKQPEAILDTETSETFETGAVILKALWSTSLPPACVTIEPAGKVRSSSLVNQLAAPNAGALANSWTIGGQAIKSPDVVKRYKSLEPNDNRIILFLRRTDSIYCRSDLLARAIERLD